MAPKREQRGRRRVKPIDPGRLPDPGQDECVTDELCAALEIDIATLRRWHSAGCPKMSEGKSFRGNIWSLSDVQAWRVTAKPATAGAENPIPPGAKTFQHTSDPKLNADIRNAEARARLIELKAQELEGALVARDRSDDVLGEWVFALRARLRGIPSRLSRDLVGLALGDIHAALQGAIDEALVAAVGDVGADEPDDG